LPPGRPSGRPGLPTAHPYGVGFRNRHRPHGVNRGLPTGCPHGAIVPIPGYRQDTPTGWAFETVTVPLYAQAFSQLFFVFFHFFSSALIISTVQTVVFSGRRNGNAQEGRKRRPFRGAACVFLPPGRPSGRPGLPTAHPYGVGFRNRHRPHGVNRGLPTGHPYGVLPKPPPRGAFPVFPKGCLATDSTPLRGGFSKPLPFPTAQAVGYRQDAPTGWEEPRQGFHVGSQGSHPWAKGRNPRAKTDRIHIHINNIIPFPRGFQPRDPTAQAVGYRQHAPTG
jgi:hypothetical protein